ncbi:MAG: hemerythrin domain-containing protein, partial [Sulfurimonas sp.]|uniref:hemerythrin domain-containing protein n=1 Tax=Sulfurimonas sp. TaxID=2022749 RepID=UPI00263023E4
MNSYINLPDGHPVKVYLEENMLMRGLIGSINSIDIVKNFEEFEDKFNKLALVEKHFARKENQLFPYLEKHGWTSPSQGMWAFHDDIRAEIKSAKGLIQEKNMPALMQQLQVVFRSLEHIMQVEEGRLLPNAMNMLDEDEWKEMRAGDEEIGWMFNVA